VFYAREATRAVETRATLQNKMGKCQEKEIFRWGALVNLENDFMNHADVKQGKTRGVWAWHAFRKEQLEFEHTFLGLLMIRILQTSADFAAEIRR
jgi:hypothetical protein